MEGDVDVFEAIRSRYSVRGYKPDPVSDETLQQVLEAARQAPTAANKQPFRIVVIHPKARGEDRPRVYRGSWLLKRPLVLAATALGLGTCWIAAFDPAAAREVLVLPDDVAPIALTPLGYPDKDRAATGRRPLDELVKYERW